MKRLLVIILLCGSCSSLPHKTDMDLTRNELEIMQEDNNLTETQKVIIKHAISNLSTASKVQKENNKLSDKLQKESGYAGAGKMIYLLIGLIFFLTIAFIIYKLRK